VTIASPAPMRFDRRPRHRRTVKHPFLGHRPLHRRTLRHPRSDRRWLRASAVPPRSSAHAGGPAGHSDRRRIDTLNARDYRVWAVVFAALAWTGFLVAHFCGAPLATSLFAVAAALTWGQALVMPFSTEDGLEFFVVSVATSSALLILVGMLLVELRFTGEFFGIFVGIGAVSLFGQVLCLSLQAAALRPKLVPPQPVPSIIERGMVLPQPVPSIIAWGMIPPRSVSSIIDWRMVPPRSVPSIVDAGAAWRTVDGIAAG
jgi:hypothetical protein